VRQNVRKLDRDIQQLKVTEQKTKNLIQQSSKRAQRNPSMAKQANQDVRIFARELIRVRKQSNRLMTSKAQLNSVQMQVNEAFSVRKIEGSIKASTGIMKDVNSLVRLPELTGTMRELSSELMKAGIIEEMLDDTLGENEMLEGEADEAEEEVGTPYHLHSCSPASLDSRYTVLKDQALFRLNWRLTLFLHCLVERVKRNKVDIRSGLPKTRGYPRIITQNAVFRRKPIEQFTQMRRLEFVVQLVAACR